MIKKLSILGLLLIPSFSFAWNELVLPGIGVDMGNSNTCSVNSDLSFDCSVSDNVFQNVGNPAWGNYSTSYWWNTEGLGFYKYSSTNSDCTIQGVITGFTFCEYDFVGNNSLQINNSMYWSNCFSRTYSYDEFSQYISSHQLKYWSPVSWSTTNGYAGLVFVFDEGAFRTQFEVGASDICNTFQYGNYGLKDFGLVGLTPDFNNLDIKNTPISNNNIPIPDGPGIDDFTYVPVKTGDRILYFEEEYNLRKNICFIGTRDLTSVYEDKIPFNEGTGYTIFDMYSHLFNTYDMSVYEVGTFWQEWHLNYQVWFQKKYGVPSMVAYYNGPGDFGINKGPDLSNPFLGNLSAYYFIASNLALGNYPSDIDGQKVAYYCYLKLGLSSFSNDGGNISINDDHDESYDENIAVYTRNQINIRNQTTGGIVINSANWDGSPLDYFTGGNNYTDFNSFFSDNFTRFKGLFNLRNSNYGLGFIPSYIVIFLMGIILFRFLRH